MGLKITKQVWEHSKLNGSDKLMLLALADHADDDGFCWPSYLTLAELTGTNPGPKNDCRQSKRTMNNLRESGELIIWEQQGQHGGRGYTNLYLIITGLSEQEVFEIVTRRFELSADEVPSVISKKGDVYTTLSYLKRVTYETLLRTREVKKGGMDDTGADERVVSKAQKGGIDTTRTIIKPSPESSNHKEKIPPKGVGKPTKRESKNPHLSRQMFTALAKVCKIDLTVLTSKTRGELNQNECALRNGDVHPDDLTDFEAWWYAHSWRGKKGQSPEPSQVIDNWGQFKDRQKGQTRLDSPSDPIPPPPQPEHVTVWESAKPMVRNQMTGATFDTLFQDAQPVERENGTFELRVKASTLEMIEARPRVKANILTALQAVKPEIHDLDFKELVQ